MIAGGVHQCQAARAARESVANDVMKRLVDLADGLENTEERLIEKLHGVMRSEDPVAAKDICAPDAPYPPMFDTMRGFMGRIERATSRINALIARTEL